MTTQYNTPEEHNEAEFYFRMEDEMRRLTKEHEEDMAWAMHEENFE